VRGFFGPLDKTLRTTPGAVVEKDGVPHVLNEHRGVVADHMRLPGQFSPEEIQAHPLVQQRVYSQFLRHASLRARTPVCRGPVLTFRRAT
jgi:hypothetical protein